MVSRNLQTAKYITQRSANRKALWKSVTSPTAHTGLGETWKGSCFPSPRITRAPSFSHHLRLSDLRHQSKLNHGTVRDSSHCSAITKPKSHATCQLTQSKMDPTGGSILSDRAVAKAHSRVCNHH